MIKKINNSTEQKDEKVVKKIKNYEIKPIEVIEKGSSLLPVLTTKGLAKIFAKKINSYRDRSIMTQKYEIS